MKRNVVIALVLVAALVLRLPYIFQSLPFFYQEDEAHHFNRLTRMVKTGDLNPHYFHKPSLHFYLRLPVYAMAFLNEVRRGTIREVGEINTKDPHGVGGYAFSASHPALVAWQRAFSLLLSLFSIILGMLLAYRLSNNSLAAMILTGLLVAVSPMDARLSCFIGVDVVMTFFCLLCTWWAYRAVDEQRYSFVLLAALAAGAAISSKYNALPIFFVPLAAALFLKSDPLKLFGTAALTALAFLACSPFIIVSIPDFLNQFAYEVWHYGVEGHVGHTAAPGLAQFEFYVRWLVTDAVGLLATIGIVIGIYFTFKKRNPGIVVLIFPVLFFSLMVAQKTNFERNMLVIIPYAACFCGIAFGALAPRLRKKSSWIAGLAIVLLILQPTFVSVREAIAVTNEPKDSRALAVIALKQKYPAGLAPSVAVDAILQPQQSLISMPGVSVLENITGEVAARNGFEVLITPNEQKLPYLTKIAAFGSGDAMDRIVQDPKIFLYQIDAEKFLGSTTAQQASPLVFQKSQIR